MPEKTVCDTHGESEKTYVCIHLIGETAGLGFNRDDPSDENPYPDSWCDNCEIIREQHAGWDDVPEDLCKITLLCAECYERSRIRNTKPSVTLDDLAGLRWKCGNCDKLHSGPVLDISFDSPHYWSNDFDSGVRWGILPSGALEKSSPTFLDNEYCAIHDEDFFVRGIIHLPIIGTAETFRWGVWGSLSRTNFESLLNAELAGKILDSPPMFSWLSTQISDYLETSSLKMYAHIQERGTRPYFRLERTEHPLALEYHHGITPERVKEIMLKRLPAQEI